MIDIKNIEDTVKQLKWKYEKVVVVGFSVGATLAWRCCKSTWCDGIVCCYGSRIRDYSNLNPVCPMLLIFAKEDSFDVDSLITRLKGKPHLEISQFDAKHGFMDSFSQNFNIQESDCAERMILDYLANISHAKCYI